MVSVMTTSETLQRVRRYTVKDRALPPADAPLLSVSEAAQRLRVSVPTVTRRIADGTLRSVKFGGRRLVLFPLLAAGRSSLAFRVAAAALRREGERRNAVSTLQERQRGDDLRSPRAA
jgi:excisionase family DNA binding protein